MDDLVEPLGLLSGTDAALAVQAGIARPLAGGPVAFTLVRAAGRAPVPVGGWQGDLSRLTTPVPAWAGLPPGLHVMGIINATPDSFSDPGALFDPARAIAAGLRMIADGAAILDIGGESTRPGSAPVAPEEEQARILPVLAGLAGRGAILSVDTRNAATMARALDAGATIVNDVSGLAHDPDAAALVAARGCPVILMHMRGTPATMNSLARYGDVATEVTEELALRIAAAERAGVDPARIAVDPGFGFAKLPAHSLALLQRLPMLCNLRRPIIAGLSRKGFIGTLDGAAAGEARDPASQAAGLLALARGAGILRVHEVAGTARAVRVWQALHA